MEWQHGRGKTQPRVGSSLITTSDPRYNNASGGLPLSDTSPDWVLSALLSGGAFILTFVFADFALPVAAGVSALAFAGGALLFRVKPAKRDEIPADLESALLEGRRKLGEIRAYGRKIPDAPTKSKVEAISESVERIFAEIRRDPVDLKTARQFLSYYLDSTVTILDKYVTISSQSVSDPGIRDSLARVECLLDTINAAFGKQLARLLSNDLLDLDTELSLLEKTLEMEGLSEK